MEGRISGYGDMGIWDCGTLCVLLRFWDFQARGIWDFGISGFKEFGFVGVVFRLWGSFSVLCDFTSLILNFWGSGILGCVDSVM